jgi:hypothetical protein
MRTYDPGRDGDDPEDDENATRERFGGLSATGGERRHSFPLLEVVDCSRLAG